MSLIAYRNRLFGDVVLTDVGGTFSTQPLSNLTRTQLPLFASFTGATAELDCEAVEDEQPDEFSADVFAVLGHTLPDNAEVEFLDGATSLGTVTVTNYRGLPQHAILILDTPVQLDTLTVSITGAGTSAQIGAVWASESFRAGFAMADYGYTPESKSDVQYADGTGYASAGATQELYQVRFPGLTRAQAEGPTWPNWRAITRLIGRHDPVLVVPDESELARSVYGRVESFAVTRPQLSKQASIWRAGLDVREDQ